MSIKLQKMSDIQSLRISVNEQLTAAGDEIIVVLEKQTRICKTQRVFVKQRLTAAAQQISGLFQRASEEYQLELDRQSRLLDILLNPQIKLHRTESSAHQTSSPEQTQPHHVDDTQSGGEPITEGLSSECSAAESEDSRGDATWRGRGDGHRDRQPAGPNRTGTQDRRHVMSRPAATHCCVLCGKAFRHKSNLVKHVETHSGDPGCLCGVCGERSQSTEALKDHLQSHRGLCTGGTCDICGKSFQNIETHMRSHTGVKPFSCSVCAKRFPRAGALRRHKKIHTRAKSHICHFCGETFTENDHLQAHIKTHKEEADDSEDDDWRETGEPPSKPTTRKSNGEKRKGSGLRSAQPAAHCCHVCGDSFHSKGFLRKHAETHSKESECRCGVCGERFESAHGLETHLQSHRETSGTCDICGKSFQNMETHMRSHTGIKPFSCGVCAKRFPRAGALRRHKKIHTGERPYICKHCGKTFIESSALKTHIKSHWWEIKGTEGDQEQSSGAQKPETEKDSPERENITAALCCLVCGASFQNKSSLRKHAETHSTDPEPLCGVCGVHLQPAESLTDHLQSHREAGKICHVCGKTYQNIETHMRSHTGVKPFSCSICAKRFPRAGALRRHKKIHTGERPYICEFCGKTFIDNGALMMHIRNHTGDKPMNRVSCNTCGKSLASVHVLEVHKRIHTGEKPFQCRVCGKAFRQVGGLNAHMMTHTGEKPFSCALCSKSFSTKGYLETHVRFHKKDKPYSCHLCWKAFVTKNDLKKHLLTHTGEKPYSCRVCGKSYQEKRSRDVHMKVHLGVRQVKESLRGHDGLHTDFIQL